MLRVIAAVVVTFFAAVFGLTIFVSIARSATISEVPGPAADSRPIEVSPETFTNLSGNCGTGFAVIGDGCSVAIKSPGDPQPRGRRNPQTGGPWVDSQDIDQLGFTLSSSETFQRLYLGFVDAFDQKKHRDYGKSFFNVTLDGATWSMEKRRENGNLFWLEIVYPEPIRTATGVINTRLDDGYTMVASAAPIPLPAGVWMILAAIGGLLGMKWSGRKAASATAALLATALVAWAPTADAQQGQTRACADRELVVERLAERYGETLQSMGLVRNNGLVEIYASRETGSWTILITRPAEDRLVACVLAAGQMWEFDASPVGPQGDPV